MVFLAETGFGLRVIPKDWVAIYTNQLDRLRNENSGNVRLINFCEKEKALQELIEYHILEVELEKKKEKRKIFSVVENGLKKRSNHDNLVSFWDDEDY